MLKPPFLIAKYSLVHLGGDPESAMRNRPSQVVNIAVQDGS